MRNTLIDLLRYANELIGVAGIEDELTQRTVATAENMIVFYNLPYKVKYHEEAEIFTLEHSREHLR